MFICIDVTITPAGQSSTKSIDGTNENESQSALYLISETLRTHGHDKVLCNLQEVATLQRTLQCGCPIAHGISSVLGPSVFVLQRNPNEFSAKRRSL